MEIIDIHSHIIPGIDDGSADERQSAEMLRAAWKAGVRSIIATSHFYSGRGQTGRKYEDGWKKLLALRDEICPDMKLYKGNEIYYSRDIVDELSQGRCHTLADSRYVLVEFHPEQDFIYIRNAIDHLRGEGYLVILAHVERYQNIISNKKNVDELLRKGVHFQMNANMAVKHGRKPFHIVRWLLKNEKISFIGSDMHDGGQRIDAIGKAPELVQHIAGSAYSEHILRKNQKFVIQNKLIK